MINKEKKVQQRVGAGARAANGPRLRGRKDEFADGRPGQVADLPFFLVFRGIVYAYYISLMC